VRRRAVTVTAAIGIAAAIMSYRHALQVVRASGTGGGWAYLPPLLPDGLIYLSALALYEAATAKVPRPRWAVAGLMLGCLITLVMNVAAGWPDHRGSALVNALAPVTMWVALEILMGILRRDRAASFPSPADSGAVTFPATLDEAVTDAAGRVPGHLSQREIAAVYGVSKTTVAKRVARVTSLNGSGGR
jgi:hypothetical protein